MIGIGEICNRNVIVVAKGESVRSAAKLMRKHHVGDVVVVDDPDDVGSPLGILTDRDIVVSIVATDLELDIVTVSDAMSFELVSAREEDDLLDTIARMRQAGVRRMPVVDDSGTLTGMLAVDDIIAVVAEQIGSLAHLLNRERRHERLSRP